MLEFHTPSEEDRDLFPKTSKYLAYEYYYSYSVIWGDAIGLTVCKTDTAADHNAGGSIWEWVLGGHVSNPMLRL